MKKAAIILSGCGVYDGTEIHEAVFTLAAVVENGGEYSIFAPNIEQHHVINHLNGDEMPEKRNVLTESARIARGQISDLKYFKANDFDMLIIPGGFGAAKNLSKWAFSGPNGEILPEVKNAIKSAISANKAICGLCMGPTLIAKALDGSGKHAHLTVGSTSEASPYDINAISEGMNSLGSVAEMKTIREISTDENLKIVTAPCYMMEGNILEIKKNIDAAIKRTFEMC